MAFRICHKSTCFVEKKEKNGVETEATQLRLVPKNPHVDWEAGASQGRQCHEIDQDTGVADSDLQPELFIQILNQQHYMWSVTVSKADFKNLGAKRKAFVSV